MPITLGIDAGGSKVHTAAYNLDQLLFEGFSGPASWATTPKEELRQHLAESVKSAPCPEMVCAGFAGLLTSGDKLEAELLLSSLFPGAAVRAVPDFEIALAACPASTSCLVISGTGSLVASRNSQHILNKSAGRGPLLGDRGSAFSVGRLALLKALEEPGNVSARLHELIAQQFGSGEEAEVLASLYRSTSPAASLASLAKIVSLDYEKGTPYAVSIVQEELGALGRMTLEHLSKYCASLDRWKVMLVGGFWETSSQLQVFFEQELRLRTKDRLITVQKCTMPPVMGAVRLAQAL